LHFSKNLARRETKKMRCTNFGSDTSIILYDTALIKEVYLNTDNYVKDPFTLEVFAPILGKGLLTSEGNQWKRQRKTLSSAFHFEFLKSTLPNVQATAHRNLSELKKGSLEKVNIMNELQRITGEVVGKVFFGEELNQYQFDGKPLTLALADLIVSLSKLLGDPLRIILGGGFIRKGILPRHRKIMNDVKKFRRICHEIVQNRKKENQQDPKKPKDLLQVLLDYSGTEGSLDDDEIVDHFVTLFLAGMDTTGHLLTMAIYHLDKYPEKKEKIIEEIQMHYKPEEEVTQDVLNKLEFTLGVLKESLRMQTPVAAIFTRQAAKDHNLGEIQIKKGTLVSLDYFYNNFNPAYFDDVDDFKPERWLDKTKSLDSYAFTPFSGGPRNCIGQHLALNESKIILAEFLTMFDFKLQDDYKLKMSSTFLYEPMEPILVNLISKS